MVRTSASQIRGKIWLPRKRPEYTIEIDGVDRTSIVIGTEFIRGIIGIECPCKLTILDPNGDFADLYTGGETIELKMTREGAERSEWKGTLERPVVKFGQTYLLELMGSHFQSDLLDITVNAEFDGTKTADTILKEIIADFVTGFTTNNVAASTVKPIIKWDSKPLHDCIFDLCTLSKFDAFIDSDKDVHFFARESNENNKESIVFNQTLIEILEFGADDLDIRNRVVINGQDPAGLPIIYRTDDADSQSSSGVGRVKEKIVKDSSIRSYSQAKQFGDSFLLDEKNKTPRGAFSCFLLTDIDPGDMVWIVHPVQGIQSLNRVVKITFEPINQHTVVVISKDRTIPQIFQERKRAELASENLANPFDMTNSFNFQFDDTSEFDSSESVSIKVAESNLQTDNATTGKMISVTRSAGSAVTQVHLRVSGDFLSGTKYFVRASETSDWEQLNLEELKTLTNPGSVLRLRVDLGSASTLIGNISLLYK